jgi:DNA polymerase-3 subunit epsilon
VKQLTLDRPLVVFDLETTGTDPAQDRIVEIGVLRIEPDGERQLRTRRVNPERAIPAEATAVHGIHDEDVRDEPTFKFNLRRFDVPLLDRELRDCGLDLGLGGRRIVDAMTIFHRKEPRNLSAAVRFYLEREHEGAHGAQADLTATLEVLEAQLERYTDLPRSVEELDAWTKTRPDAIDESGKFVRRGDDVVFAFGKHRGRSLRDVAAQAPDYLDWVVGSDFPEDAKQLVREVLAELRGSG